MIFEFHPVFRYHIDSHSTYPTGAPDEQLGLLSNTRSYSRYLISVNCTFLGAAESFVEAVKDPTLPILKFPRGCDTVLDSNDSSFAECSGEEWEMEGWLRTEGVLLSPKKFFRETVVELSPDSEASRLLWLPTDPCFLRRRSCLNILIAMEQALSRE